MKCRKCKSMADTLINIVSEDTHLHVLCHKCYTRFNSHLASRKHLGNIMRRGLPLRQQHQIQTERRLAYAQAEVPVWR